MARYRKAGPSLSSNAGEWKSYLESGSCPSEASLAAKAGISVPANILATTSCSSLKKAAAELAGDFIAPGSEATDKSLFHKGLQLFSNSDSFTE